MEYALQFERRRRVIRALPLIALLVPLFAWSQTYIDLPWVLANAMSTNGTANQCWGMDPTGAFQEWITPSGSGGGITAGTGDVTFSGTGSVATTVAKIAGVAVGTPSGTGNVVMSASPTLTGTISAAAETLTGLLTHPNGLVNAPSTGFVNSATTGVWSPTGGTFSLAFAGATPTEFGASYEVIGKSVAGATPNGNGAYYVFEPGSTTNWWGFGGGPNFAVSRTFNIQANGVGSVFGISAASTGMMFFNAAGVQGTSFFQYDFISRSTQTTPTWVGVQSTYPNDAMIAIRNQGTATNGNHSFVMWVGDSTVGDGGIMGVHDVNDGTAAHDQGHTEIWGAIAGTKASHFKFQPNGNVEINGTTPTIASGACGTTTSATVVGNNSAGTITVGTGGVATSCTLTFSTVPAWANAPHCFINDQSAIVAARAVPTTAALVITESLAFTAGGLLDYHCVGHF